jgi:hypothetical protein
MNASTSSALNTSATATVSDLSARRYLPTAHVVKTGAAAVLAAATFLTGGVIAAVASPASAATALPGSANTGMPAGVSRVHVGDLVVTRAGTVIDRMDVRGFVIIKAANVVIKNSIVRGRTITATGNVGMVKVLAGGSLTMTDSSIGPTVASVHLNGVVGSNFTLRRVEIARMVDSVRIQGDNVRVEASWLHANRHYLVDPTQGYKPSHDDGIQIEKGNNINILGNTIDGAVNAAVMAVQGLGTISHLNVSRNYLGGGGCTVNFAEYGKGPFRYTTVSSNRFGHDTSVAKCPIISPTTTKLTAAGNVYNDTNLPAVIRKS